MGMKAGGVLKQTGRTNTILPYNVGFLNDPKDTENYNAAVYDELQKVSVSTTHMFNSMDDLREEVDKRISAIERVDRHLGDIEKKIGEDIDSALKLLKDNIYHIGAYYITESDKNPSDPDLLGFGVWVKLTGMIMGSGVIDPDPNVPNSTRIEYKVGNTGGRPWATIEEMNIPQLVVDSKNFSIIDYEHDHGIHMIQDSTALSGSNILQKDITTGAGTERRSLMSTNTPIISGIVRLGRAESDRQPINTMSPYRVANIWRREA